MVIQGPDLENYLDIKGKFQAGKGTYPEKSYSRRVMLIYMKPTVEIRLEVSCHILNIV